MRFGVYCAAPEDAFRSIILFDRGEVDVEKSLIWIR